MAIEQRYRFSSVDDFVFSLTKRKRVASVKKERSRRRRRRAIGILVSLMVIVGASAIAYYIFNRRQGEPLSDATLNMWYIQTGNNEVDESKVSALESIIKSFTSEHNNIEITLSGIPAESYLSDLMEAVGTGQAPSIFESTGFDVSNFAVTPPKQPERPSDILTKFSYW